MEDAALFYQGGSNRIWSDKLKEILFDLLDVSLYRKLQARFSRPTREDLLFNSNQDFWNHILQNRAYIDQYITISNFYLTEWVPMSEVLPIVWTKNGRVIDRYHWLRRLLTNFVCLLCLA